MFITNLNSNRRNLIDEIFRDLDFVNDNFLSKPYPIRNSSDYKIDSDDDACDIHSEACGVDPNDNVEARIGRAQGISARSSGAMQTPWS